MLGSRVRVQVTPYWWHIYQHLSRPLRFITFHQSLCWCDRRGRPAPLVITDLQYRSFIVFSSLTWPCVGHELRFLFMLYLIKWLPAVVGFYSIAKIKCVITREKNSHQPMSVSPRITSLTLEHGHLKLQAMFIYLATL